MAEESGFQAQRDGTPPGQPICSSLGHLDSQACLAQQLETDFEGPGWKEVLRWHLEIVFGDFKGLGSKVAFRQVPEGHLKHFRHMDSKVVLGSFPGGFSCSHTRQS